MRKLSFLVILTVVCQLPSFSQSYGQPPIGSTGKYFSFSKGPLAIRPNDSIDYKGFLKKPANESYFPDYKLNDKNIQVGQLRTLHLETPYYFDNMPCLKPQGPFNMPVYKPDTSVNFTLLVKKPYRIIIIKE
jgi:hypothetical protein